MIPFEPNATILFNPDNPATRTRQFFMFCPDEDGNGPMYTETEWIADSTADWEVTAGEVRFQGGVHPTPHEVEFWNS